MADKLRFSVALADKTFTSAIFARSARFTLILALGLTVTKIGPLVKQNNKSPGYTRLLAICEDNSDADAGIFSDC